MDRTEVVSSNIAEAGYDKKTKTMEVMFKNGGVYQYKRVPESLYKEFMKSASQGSFLAQRIRGIYNCEKVDE